MLASEVHKCYEQLYDELEALHEKKKVLDLDTSKKQDRYQI
jgi:hypothetical protein